MLLKEYKEAYDVYRNTAKLYCEELGVPPGPEMVSRLRRIESQIKNPVGNFEDLKENFREQKNTGAYYCLYPSFLDSCQLLARVAERSGRSIFLMLLKRRSVHHLQQEPVYDYSGRNRERELQQSIYQVS